MAAKCCRLRQLLAVLLFGLVELRARSVNFTPAWSIQHLKDGALLRLELGAVAGLGAHFKHVAAGSRRQVDIGFIQSAAAGAQMRCAPVRQRHRAHRRRCPVVVEGVGKERASHLDTRLTPPCKSRPSLMAVSRLGG
jgi:hypothetical protein